MKSKSISYEKDLVFLYFYKTVSHQLKIYELFINIRKSSINILFHKPIHGRLTLNFIMLK